MPGVRCPLLIGRTAELEALRAAVTAACQGRGTALAVVGEPGIGKSRLVGEIPTEGFRTPVMVGRAVGDGQPVPFRPLVEALLGGLRSATHADLTDLGPFRPVLARLLPQFRDGAAAADDSPVVLAEAVLRLLRTLSRDHTAVIVQEDLQWADPESLLVIEYLADNIADSPLVLVLTARDERGAARTIIHRLAIRGSVTVIELAPLDDTAVLDMATACLGRVPDARLLALVRERAEGIPLLVEELLGAGRRADDESPLPATVVELTRFRLAAVPDVARRCVRVAALLGQRFDAELLPAATGLDAATVTRALQSAVDAQLLDSDDDGRLQFRHALTRDAVIAALLPPERAELAGRTLQAVESAHPGLDDPWCHLAAQLAAVADDATRACRLLLDAGRRDLGRGALATAEATLVRARGLATQDPDLSADIDETLAEVLVLAGHPERAAQVTTRLVGNLHNGDEESRRLAAAHLRLARAWTVAEQWDSAAVQVEQALRIPLHDAGLTAQADLLRAHVALGHNDFGTAELLAARVQATAEDVGEWDLVCEALELRGRLARRYDLAAAATLFDQERQVAQARELPVWQHRVLHELGTVDALDSLRLDVLHEARERATRAGALAVRADVDLHRAGVHLVRGEIDASLQASRSCADTATRLRLPTLPMALVVQALALVARHEVTEAERLLTGVLAQHPDHAPACAEAWHARATRWLLAEDRPRARAAADCAMEHLRRASAVTSLPSLGRWALLATLDGDDEALTEAGAIAGARVARWNRGFLGYAEAVRLGRRDRIDEAEARFASADEAMARPVPMPAFRHVSRRLVAEAAMADGWGRPVEWLGEDLIYFEATGTDRVATACRGLLRRAGAPVPRRTFGQDVPPALRQRGVTARERDVLVLLSEGMSNREIASSLFLSPRTVEKHVERLLAKAGVSGRAQLRVWASSVLVS